MTEIMNKRILDILRARFLVSETAPRNWRILIFLAVLGTLDVTSSHVADWQVHRNEDLRDEVTVLKNELVIHSSELQQWTMESYLEEQFREQGLKRPDTTIRKWVVNTTDQWQLANKE